MDSTDSVVMGGQKKRDTLAEMPRFGGRNVQDGEVFPVWLKELTKKVKFDVGDIGVRIIKGEVRRGDIKTGDRAYDHRDLIQLCLTKGGRGVTVFTKDWLEVDEGQGGRGRGRGRGRGGRGRGQGAEDADDVFGGRVLTYIGALNLQECVTNVFKSYFNSIAEYGLVQGSEVHKECVKLEEKYNENTLPDWISAASVEFGIDHVQLKDTYIEMFTASPTGQASRCML